jgi:RNA polymerase sigma-70 factor (ECF subfamily)
MSLTGNPVTAEDVVQDAFEKAFAGLARFDESRPFAPWFNRIVVNRAINVAKRERRLTSLDEGLPSVEAAEGTAGNRELLRMVARLPAKHRAVVILRFGLDFPPHEVAELMGVPVGTVHSRLSRALTELRTTLEVDDVARA